MIKIIAFIVIAVALIWGGRYLNQRSDNEAKQKAVAEGEQQKNKQAEIMANFRIEDVVVGTGDEAKNGDSVTVNYTGRLESGTVFDSNVDPKFNHVDPFVFTLGAGQVIQGWDMGVLGMKVGGKRALSIPPELGYGERGSGPIPSNSTLNFTVELLGVKKSVDR